MTIESVLSSTNKYGSIEMNGARVELLDIHGYPVIPEGAQQIDAINVQTLFRKTQIDDRLVEDLARTFGLVYNVNGKNLIYIEGTDPQSNMYIVSRRTAEKDYRSTYADEIEAFGERIVERDLSNQCILGSFETREVSPE